MVGKNIGANIERSLSIRAESDVPAAGSPKWRRRFWIRRLTGEHPLQELGGHAAVERTLEPTPT